MLNEKICDMIDASFDEIKNMCLREFDDPHNDISDSSNACELLMCACKMRAKQTYDFIDAIATYLHVDNGVVYSLFNELIDLNIDAYNNMFKRRYM